MQLRIQYLIATNHIRWKRLLISIIIWVVSEVGLTWIGLDDLADCGEYIFKHREAAIEISPVLQGREPPTTALVIPQINS